MVVKNLDFPGSSSMKEIQLSLLVVLCTELVRDCRLTYVCYTTKAWPEEQVAHASARRSATCTPNSFRQTKLLLAKVVLICFVILLVLIFGWDEWMVFLIHGNQLVLIAY